MTIRSFTDGEGRPWRVWHVVPQNDVLKHASPSLEKGWLCFENNTEKRRLVTPAENWHELTDAELVALLDTATPVRRLEPRAPA